MKNLLFSIFILFGSFAHSQAFPEYYTFNTAEKPTALLILFDGGAGRAERIPNECNLPDSASKYGIVTIGIDQSSFHITEDIYRRVRTISLNAKADFGADYLFLGGFSLGGYTALRLAEIAVERGDSAFIPDAVFGVDPPLDHIQFVEYCHRELNRTCHNPLSEAGKQEAQWILSYYNQHFGSLDSNRAKYVEHSVYSDEIANGGNARYLSNIPIHLFHELDAQWLMKERCRDLRDTNGNVGSQFISHLYNNGNTQATISLTTDLGYRSDGRRHPHSWSIAQPQVVFPWLISQIAE